MALNPFQQGEQFAVQEEKAELANEAAAQFNIEAERKERGINAIGEMFGEAALAPSEFAAVTGANRAERRLESDLSQRDIGNERVNEDRKVTEEGRERTRMLSAASSSVAFLKNAQEQGMDMSEAVNNIMPTLNALGFTEEDLQGLPQILSEDPQAIAGLEAMVGDLRNQGDGRAQRRVIKTENILLPDDGSGEQKTGQRITRADGSVETITGGGTPLNFVLASGRLAVSEARIDPAKVGDVEEEKSKRKVVGKAKGEIIAGDLPPGKRATAQGKILLEQRELKTEFLQNTLDTALSQVTGFSTGIFSGFRFVGGTPQADLSATLDTIRANIGFEELQRMRDASKTGGALGQVSERENELLQAVWGSIQQSQSAEQLAENLKILKTTIEASRLRVAAAWEADFGTVYGGEGSQIPSIEGADPEIDALLNKYGVTG